MRMLLAGASLRPLINPSKQAAKALVAVALTDLTRNAGWHATTSPGYGDPITPGSHMPRPSAPEGRSVLADALAGLLTWRPAAAPLKYQERPDPQRGVAPEPGCRATETLLCPARTYR